MSERDRTPGTWRHKLRPMILRVLSELGTRRRRVTKRKALRDAYPFPERKGRAYQVWLDEVRVQLGLSPPRRGYLEPLADSPGQKLLFDD